MLFSPIWSNLKSQVTRCDCESQGLNMPARGNWCQNCCLLHMGQAQEEASPQGSWSHWTKETAGQLGEGCGGDGGDAGSGGHAAESSLYVGAPKHDESVKVLHKENAGGSTMVALAWL